MIYIKIRCWRFNKSQGFLQNVYDIHKNTLLIYEIQYLISIIYYYCNVLEEDSMSNRGNIYQTRVHYEYELDDNVRVQYAHGVWGGITKHGEIELNFYLEHDKVGVKKERTVPNKDSMTPTHYITRLVHSRILLNSTTARSILEWLEEKIQTLELDEEDSISYPILECNTKEQ